MKKVFFDSPYYGIKNRTVKIKLIFKKEFNMKKLDPIFVKRVNVDQNNILSKRQLKHLIGGYGDGGYGGTEDPGYGTDGGDDNSSGRYKICCRKANESGCDYTFYNSSCDDPYSLCAMYSTSNYYTCVSVPK